MAAEDAGDLTQEERALAKGGLAGWQVRAISRLAEAQLESLTVRAMAAAVDLSPHHFSRPFRMSFGAPPREWLIRYERERPGELLHLDIKILGRIDGVGHRIIGGTGIGRKRGLGWDHLHVAVDDASRLAYTKVLPGLNGEDAAVFLERALASYARLAVIRLPDVLRLGLYQPALISTHGPNLSGRWT